jgi:hypothetical protein
MTVLSKPSNSVLLVYSLRLLSSISQLLVLPSRSDPFLRARCTALARTSNWETGYCALAAIYLPDPAFRSNPLSSAVASSFYLVSEVLRYRQASNRDEREPPLAFLSSSMYMVAGFCVCRDCGYARDTEEAASRWIGTVDMGKAEEAKRLLYGSMFQSVVDDRGG